MDIKYMIEKKLDYINMGENATLSYNADDNNALRAVDHLGRVLYVKQFQNKRELFQFLCGMVHVLEVI